MGEPDESSDNLGWEYWAFYGGTMEQSCAFGYFRGCKGDIVAVAERVGRILAWYQYRWSESEAPNTIDCSHFVQTVLQAAGCDVDYVATADMATSEDYTPSSKAVGTIWVAWGLEASGDPANGTFKVEYVHHEGFVGKIAPNGNPLVVQVGKHPEYWGNPTYIGQYGAGVSIRYYRPVCH